ncbi:M48 family metallopeptidase [Marinobacterium sp. YM272]|uniref:M48 family metallopeptidase n=1 Tax=Marinobacterium sp. YM272 TaxID=3421654 RepID=UPI003D7F59D0
MSLNLKLLTRFIRTLVPLAGGLALAGCATSPTGENTLLLNSPTQMNALGQKSFEQVKANTAIETNPGINRYVRCVSEALLDRLPARYGIQPQQWEILVFRNEAVNAFAVPGGKIGVYTGMLDMVENQDQLASVIGHEISHVLAQHSNARLSQQQLTSAGLSAANLLLTNRVEAGTQQALMSAMGLGAQYGVILPYSRAHEREADVLGQELMADAGFDPREAASLWRKMASEGGSTPPEFLSTHPAPTNRVTLLNERVQKLLPIYLEARDAGRAPRCEAQR